MDREGGTCKSFNQENKKIIERHLELIQRCFDYQFAKLPKTYKDDLMQDCIVEMMEYPKLAQVEQEGHMNAWITRYIANNVYSRTSWYWRRYIRPDKMSDEITEKERQIEDA